MCAPRSGSHVAWIKPGGAGGRFGDYLGVDCANLLCLKGRDPFTNTKFTRPIGNISKSSLCSCTRLMQGRRRRYRQQRRPFVALAADVALVDPSAILELGGFIHQTFVILLFA